jgi:hypothetical protein
MPPLDRSNPRTPERDEAPAIDGLSDNEVVVKPFRDTLRGPDELHCRWAPWDDGRGRGWVAFTDPFTGEEIQVASKYMADRTPPPWKDPRYVPEGETAEPCPQTFVWRAMDAKDREKTRQARQRHSSQATNGAPYGYDPQEPL